MAQSLLPSNRRHNSQSPISIMYLDLDERAGLITVSLAQAEVAEKSGDIEGAKALRANAKRLRFSLIEEQVKKDPQLIQRITIEAIADPWGAEDYLELLIYLTHEKGYDANP